MKGTSTQPSMAPLTTGALPPIIRAAPRTLPTRSGLGHAVDAVHAMHAVFGVERQLLGFSSHSRAQVGQRRSTWWKRFSPSSTYCRTACLVDPQLVAPQADDRQVGAGAGRRAIVGAARALHLELVGERGAMDLVLEVHRQVVGDVHRVDAGVLAARRPHAAA